MDWDSKQWVDIVDTLERMVHDYMAEVGMIERIGRIHTVALHSVDWV